MIAMNGVGGRIASKEGSSHAGTKRANSKQLRRLVDKQKYRCALSGRELTPETAAVDHVIPITKGGTSNIGNLQILHCDVNAAKGAMTSVEFVAMCREVVAWSDGQESGTCDPS
jgi:5-methylcytosine-specific restriction endonuclease McrA